MIFATLGTMHLDFARLIRKMDAIAERTGERVVIQTGLAKTLPGTAEHFAFRPRAEIESLIAESRLVVTHAGIGSVLDALKAQRSLIVIPRLRKFREHNNDHQLDLARAIDRRGWGRMVLEVDELDELCATPPEAHTRYAPAKEALLATVRQGIGELSLRRAG
jgi:UDP-N-acetylglucosamine transferase subunit ALG13